MSTYTTVASVKQQLGVTGTNDDTLLTRLITAASGFIDNYTNRPNGLALATYTDIRDGNGRSTMTLTENPVQSVASLLMDGQLYNQLLPQSVGVAQQLPAYGFDSCQLKLAGFRFNPGIMNVQVVYASGYSGGSGYMGIPEEIEQACIDMVAMKYALRKKAGISSEGLVGIGQVVYMVKDIPYDMTLTLDSYKRVAYVTDY